VNTNPPSGDIFGSVGSEGLKVAGIVGVVLLAPMLFVMAALGDSPGIAQSPASAAALAEIPAEHLAVMQQVAAATGVPWQVLAAIAKVESGFGANMGPSAVGALGYCQLPAAAQLLLGSGAPGDLRQALYAYNHSWSYVDHVLSIATSYGYLDPAGIPAQAVALARSRLGLPYVWGAAGPDSFDCSGLTQWVYAQLGVALPRTSQAQFNATMPVALEFLQPGDLLFYENTYPSHERITHVGIYAGNGVVIMATQPGEFVKEVPLSDPYWARHFAGAGRPVKGPQA
jgi:cell wall-associated NlpC family hydrolase